MKDVNRKIKMYFSNGSTAILTVFGRGERQWSERVAEAVKRHSAIKWHVAERVR